MKPPRALPKRQEIIRPADRPAPSRQYISDIDIRLDVFRIRDNLKALRRKRARELCAVREARA